MRLFFVFMLLLGLSGLIACNKAPDVQDKNTQPAMIPNAEQPTSESMSDAAAMEKLPEADTPAKTLSAASVPSSPKPTAVKVADKVGTPSTPPPVKSGEIPEVKEKLPPLIQEELPAPKATIPATQVASEEKSQPTHAAVPEKVKISTADHNSWDALLRKYVSADGRVNYAGLKSEQTKLQAYLGELGSYTVQADWSRAEKMAYWINAYNAFTIKLILDNYPISSITNLHNGKPWDIKWIKLGDKTYSLNQIENDILRPQFKDARIHFALNCAAKSCPPLLNRAWTAENLNSYLDQQAKTFVNNPAFNTLNAKKVSVSKIFDWYSTDFGNLIGFLNKYSETSLDSKAEVSYQEYDWALNN